MKNKLEHPGDYNGWQLYKNSEGFIEGYRSTGVEIIKGVKRIKDSRRVVSNQKTPAGFLEYLKGMKPRRKLKDIALSASHLPSLFPGE